MEDTLSPPRRPFAQLFADLSVSAVVAGLIAVLISYAGPLVIVFQAARLANLTTAQTSSWIWALSIGSGVTGLLLSWRFKTPVITAWSTPGAALLVVMLPGLPLAEAVGAYLVAALALTALGLSGLLDKLVARIPQGIAAALLAGILLRFGLAVFGSVEASPALVLAMIAAYLAGRRLLPRYAIALVMAVGIGGALALGDTRLAGIELALVRPEFTAPAWSWHAVLSLGLPLALVTLTGQHMPGLAVLRTAGYAAPAGAMVATTGIVSLLLAPFGAHGLNLAAITAAICTGREAHEDPARRYVAGLACGLFYLAIGLCGGTLALLFAALPQALIAALAGLALIGAITTGLAGLVQDEAHRDAGVITFLVAASGMSLLGLGAAFWGLALGGIACVVLHGRWPARLGASGAPGTAR